MHRRSTALAALLATVGAAGAVGTAVAAAPAASAKEPTPAAGLATFYQQKVAWAPCEPADGEPPEMWKGVECATVTVPLDYRRPAAGKLSIAVSRIKAAKPARRQGVLLLNPGGPSGSGLDLPSALTENAIAGSYDLIGFDPRGVGRSTELLCEVTPGTDLAPTRPTDAQMRTIAAQAQRRERYCRRAAGGIRPFISTANTARDMDVIRGILGERKINYLGFSYGTYLGAVYGSLFPARLNRSVLDSAMHPDWLYYEQSRQVAVAAKQNVDAWILWVAERNKTYRLGSSPAQVRANLDALGARLAAKPVKLPPPLPYGFPRDGIDRNFFDAFLGEWSRGRDIWDFLTEMVDEIRDAAGAAPSSASTLSPDAGKALAVLARFAIAETQNGVYQTVTCEADWPRDLRTYFAQMRKFRKAYPYGPGAMAAAPTECTFRSFTPPEPLVDLRRKGYPTGLVIQAEGDGNTQYDGGPAMAGRLRDNLISVPDDGSHGLYARNECVTRKVDDYLIHGVLPSSRSVCPGAPRPEVPADKASSVRKRSATAEKSLEIQAREAVAAHTPPWRH